MRAREECNDHKRVIATAVTTFHRMEYKGVG